MRDAGFRVHVPSLAMLAPVLCQPALPDLSVLAYRFDGDPFCRSERFAAYREALGTRFDGRVLSDETANTDVPSFFAEHVPAPHSVVTVHLVDRVGEPTLTARDEIIAFLRQRLQP